VPDKKKEDVGVILASVKEWGRRIRLKEYFYE
jgi:hypothetical protein